MQRVLPAFLRSWPPGALLICSFCLQALEKGGERPTMAGRDSSMDLMGLLDFGDMMPIDETFMGNYLQQIGGEGGVGGTTRRTASCLPCAAPGGSHTVQWPSNA